MKFKDQFLALFSISCVISTPTFAYTVNRCETADESKAVCILFDAANNYFVLGSLIAGTQQTPGVSENKDPIRPRPIDPNHPLLKIAFGKDSFLLSLDATTATLTSSNGVVSMVCNQDFQSKCPDFQ